MSGGTYENLCASTGIGSGLSDKRFIHFELTKVKANPFVASVVMSLLFDVINNKILSDQSKKGYIIFDEYAETAQMKSSTSLDVDIHQTVAFFYQKIRKENGAVMTIIQSPVQLPSNEYTDGIIANTQLLYVLEGTEVVYDAIVKTFKIKNDAHINQMKSIQNNYDAIHPYSECWIRFGENYALTIRLEASLRKFLAFQTQGELRSELDRIYGENGHNMQKAIEQYIETTKKA
jgi:conjugation system ATPase, TraG family